MITENVLRDLLITERLNATQAALRLDVSVGTIGRYAKRYGIAPGQGVQHRWAFETITPALSYIIGSYLTDGYISKEYQSSTRNSLILSVTSMAFHKHFCESLTTSGLPVSIKEKSPHDNSFAVKWQFAAACHSTLFASWLYEQCERKEHIPTAIATAPRICKLEFLAAIIDGDGHVTKDGTIRIRKTAPWLLDLPDLLTGIGVRWSVNLDSILPQGKHYWAITIRRADYRAIGGTCYVPEKAERIANAVEVRRERRPQRVAIACAQCGSIRAGARPGGLCRLCYRSSKQLHDHLTSIATAGNIAANIARWGNKVQKAMYLS